MELFEKEWRSFIKEDKLNEIISVPAILIALGLAFVGKVLSHKKDSKKAELNKKQIEQEIEIQKRKHKNLENLLNKTEGAAIDLVTTIESDKKRLVELVSSAPPLEAPNEVQQKFNNLLQKHGLAPNLKGAEQLDITKGKIFQISETISSLDNEPIFSIKQIEETLFPRINWKISDSSPPLFTNIAKGKETGAIELIGPIYGIKGEGVFNSNGENVTNTSLVYDTFDVDKGNDLNELNSWLSNMGRVVRESVVRSYDSILKTYINKHVKDELSVDNIKNIMKDI